MLNPPEPVIRYSNMFIHEEGLYVRSFLDD